MNKKNGFSIVEVLISVGIMSIMIMFVLSILNTQQKEVKSLKEILGSTDLQKTLTVALSNNSVCTYILNNPVQLTFDSTAPFPQTITPSVPIYASVTAGVPGSIVAQIGQSASAFSNSLIVNSIDLNITGGSGTTYIGNWRVGFNPAQTVRPVRNASISTIMTVDTTIPTAARIVSCMAGGGGILSACYWRPTELFHSAGITNTDMCGPGEVMTGLRVTEPNPAWEGHFIHCCSLN